ncbi:flagellar basal body-associated protein FliL [Endozoicomonas sp.]|uniref:flagellar basal body-associated FliL family protein n=1 Tax=Endozoicomonas sp. TaxID=1892382 RepID=UPI002884A96C|nr:flagellar basal body-associated FliL family protein [Endozoicomonas sp.]
MSFSSESLQPFQLLTRIRCAGGSLRVNQKGAISMPVMVLAGIITVAVIAAGVFWSMNQRDDSSLSDNGSTLSSAPPQFLIFKDIIVNLLNEETDEPHFMQMDITLMTRSSPCYEALDSNQPVIRNALLDMLVTWSFQEIQLPENRDVLRQRALDIIHKLPNLPKAREVASVLITNMVVQ